MLRRFSGGRYKYTPISKYMFAVKFFRRSGDENTVTELTELSQLSQQFGGSFFANIDTTELSSVVSKVSVPKFTVEMETLDHVGPYGIKVPKQFVLDSLSIYFNIEKKLIAERFYNLLLSRMVNLNDNSGGITGARKPRAEYEIEIKVGLFEESSGTEIMSYQFHQCIMDGQEGLELSYDEQENIDQVKMSFYPNDGITIEYNEDKVRSIAGIQLAAGAIGKYILYFGAMALDTAANLAQRELSFLQAKYTDKDINLSVVTPQ